VTLAVGLGIALHLIARADRGRAGIPPRTYAVLSNDTLAGVAVAMAILLWSYATWWTGHLIESGLEGFQSTSAISFDLMLGVPLGVLLPLAAGWAFYCAMHVAPPAGDSNAQQASSRLLGNVLSTFGMLWIAFAGACTLSGGFSGRPQLMLKSAALLSAALIIAYGAVFLVAGWRLRVAADRCRARVASGPLNTQSS
jgi:hypothetical protein